MLVGLLRLLFSIEKDFVFDAAKQERALRLLLGRTEAAVFAAEIDGEAVGMCTGQLLISTAQGGPSALIEDVAVLPAQQGKGIGRRLVAAAEAWAVSQGASRVQLLADRNNAPALAFIKKRDFRPRR